MRMNGLDSQGIHLDDRDLFREREQEMDVGDSVFDQKEDQLEPMNAIENERVDAVHAEGVQTRTDIDPYGHLYREYDQDGRTIRTRTSIDDGIVWTRYFDARENVYKKKVTQLLDHRAHTLDVELRENIQMHQGPFRAKTDALGRLTEAHIDHIECTASAPSHSEQLMIEGLIEGDVKGYLIAPDLGGLHDEVNAVAMSPLAAQKQFALLEQYLRDLVREGKQVGYTVFVHYPNQGNRPSSFTVELTVDGVIEPLHDWLRIENITEESYEKLFGDSEALDQEERQTPEQEGSKGTELRFLHRLRIWVGEYLNEHPEIKKSIDAGLLALPANFLRHFYSYLKGTIGWSTCWKQVLKDTAKVSGFDWKSASFLDGVVQMVRSPSFLQTAGNVMQQVLQSVFPGEQGERIQAEIQKIVRSLQKDWNESIQNEEEEDTPASTAQWLDSLNLKSMIEQGLGNVLLSMGTSSGSPVVRIFWKLSGLAISSGLYEAAVEKGMKIADPLWSQLMIMKDEVLAAVAREFPKQEGSVQQTLNQVLHSLHKTKEPSCADAPADPAAE